MGGGDQDQTQSGSSTWNPAQNENYQNLLDRADAWLAGGGINMGQDYSGQMEQVLAQNAGFYQDMMTGGYDKQALNNAMAANASMLQQNFNRNVLPSISSGAQQTGTGNSSRRGVAEGIAASDLNQQIANQNSQMIWQAEQQANANRMAGAQGMNNLFGQYNQLAQYQQARQNSYLESLLAYKNLISGDFGGTENTSGTASVKA